MCWEGWKGLGWQLDLHEEGTPAACLPGFEPRIYGVGDKCVSDMLFPDVVVYWLL